MIIEKVDWMNREIEGVKAKMNRMKTDKDGESLQMTIQRLKERKMDGEQGV